jgi:amino acid permease
MHHSIPAMVTPIKNQEQMKIMFIGGYVFAIIVLSIIPVLGILAFGSNLTNPNPDDIKYFNEDFQ